MSTWKHLLVTLLALAALPQGAAAGLRQLTGEKEFCMEIQKIYGSPVKGWLSWILEYEIIGFNANNANIGCSGGTNSHPSRSSLTIAVVNGQLKIPKTHDDKPITKIGNEAFKGCTELASVMIPNSVTEIGSRAFADCTKLELVQMPSVTKIGGGAFQSCTELTSVRMPFVTEIGFQAFRSCTKLELVQMPSVTKIGGGAFAGCTKLASVEMPSVTEIGVNAFRGCTKLASVEMPSVTEIGDNAFAATSLRSVDSTVTMTVTMTFSGNTACDQPLLQDTCSSPMLSIEEPREVDVADGGRDR